MHSSEQEQIEALKDWWQENGKAVVLGVVLGLGAIFGYRFWDQYTDTRARLAGGRFTQLMADLGENKDPAALRGVIAELREEHAGTLFAEAAGLVDAKLAVDEDALEAAAAALAPLAGEASEAPLAQLAVLRLATVQLAAGRVEEAGRTLEADLPAAYRARQAELRGDVARARGDLAAALAAYDEALAAELPPPDRMAVEIKRSEVLQAQRLAAQQERGDDAPAS
ncbi:MAG: hypothetical protein KatS3mg121_0011 [Gammaproteobacteria bacterium]|nr:MAG: hypothetical protein KatS3mg121_0011 [Gammaproteobacteria bacterium]